MSFAPQLLETMQRYWGYDSFRPLQAEAMDAVMSDRDSLVVLPTGGGKSLCFQVPAVCREGLTLVISPLISLMKDQVDALRTCGVPAAAINSTLTPAERRQVAEQIRAGELKIVYVAPERLLASHTLEFFQSVPLALIAIDEAHCISQWGHDFRPEYRGLAILKQAFPGVGIHAYTATAAEAIRQDIVEQLGLTKPQILVGSFDRPNLNYQVKRASKKFEQICTLIEKHRGEAGIVYCISRKEVDQLASDLKQRGYRTAPYHAGLADLARQRNQEAFLQERVDIVVATVAFGMGIDKSNVRFVIHAGMPKSLEHYVQESGRAGRDGLSADCLLIHSGRDYQVWRTLIENGEAESNEGALAALQAMTQFCHGVGCRHQALVGHFGQTLDRENCDACDVCLGGLELVDEPLIVAQKIVSCVARLQERFGMDYTAKVLVGSQEERILQLGHDRLSTYGLLKETSSSAVRTWIDQLVSQEFLAKEGEYNTLRITDTGRDLLRGNATPQLTKPAQRSTSSRTQSSRTSRESPAADWEGVDRGLFNELRKLRTAIAAERGVPPYLVFSDAALRDMSRLQPTTSEEFLNVRGVGQQKQRDFGQAFVAAIQQYSA
ncbi:MAG: DNA helicase RecQ [Bythopirellula sp.]|nr:DNA helicase RecQ [Bythopirellula sp.]